MKRIVSVVLAAALAVTLAGIAGAEATGPTTNARPGFGRGLGPGAGPGAGQGYATCPRPDCPMNRGGAIAPRIQRREMRQEMRIRRGRMSGQITPGEGRFLRMHQRHIRAMEMRARRDGDFSMRERARVNRALDRQSRCIRRMRWNGRSI